MIYDLLNWLADLLMKQFKSLRKLTAFFLLVFEGGEMKNSDSNRCSFSHAIHERIEFIKISINHKKTERLNHTNNSFRFLLKIIHIFRRDTLRNCLWCQTDHWNSVFFIETENMMMMQTKCILTETCKAYSQTKESEGKNILSATLLETERMIQLSLFGIDGELLI